MDVLVHWYTKLSGKKWRKRWSLQYSLRHFIEKQWSMGRFWIISAVVSRSQYRDIFLWTTSIFLPLLKDWCRSVYNPEIFFWRRYLRIMQFKVWGSHGPVRSPWQRPPAYICMLLENVTHLVYELKKRFSVGLNIISQFNDRTWELSLCRFH